MSVRSALILAASVFVLTLLVRLPASVLLAHAPAALQCTGASGTLWRGSCGVLAFGPRSVRDVRWTLHPGPLLRARVALDLDSLDPDATGQAYLEWRPGGELLIERLNAQLAASQSAALMPAGWSGSLQLAIQRAHVRAGHLVDLAGTLDLRQLQLRAPRTAFGSYELVVAPVAGTEGSGDAPMLGTLRDLEGPLSLRGQMRLTAQGSYELSGQVA
ncbi:MAG TPA: type II secretion system protein N, partial [Steroidobacteraceae bacterium]|nr:type II secretion system protein N [Steroidobacteraceae bacterium]